MPQMHVEHVKSNELALAVTRALEEWDASVIMAVEAASRETAEEAADMLHTAGTFENRTGKYRKGWKVTSRQKHRGDTEQIVHNKTDYQLTHLLEYGHAGPNGGRNVSRAFEHIKPVADKCPEIFEKKLVDILGTPGGSIK